MESTEPSRGQASVGAVSFAIGISILALILSLVGIFLPASTGSAGTEGPAPKQVDVVLTEFAIAPASITVTRGQQIEFHVTNSGNVSHDFRVNGSEGTRTIAPGRSETVTVAGPTTSVDAWCTLPGHRAAGMVMKVVVSG